MTDTELNSLQKSKQELFAQHLPSLLDHLINGEIKKGKIFGIHFFRSSHHKIAEIIKPANSKGVWEARIEVRHPNTNAWVKKEKSSTLFPVSWNASQLSAKIEEAFLNSSGSQPYKQTGKTGCGIRIVFILQKNEIRSCYPLLD